jgi:hypothetical protein
MSENRTASMLQRVPLILAVTAGSYGLSMQDDGTRDKRSTRGQQGSAGQKAAAGAQAKAATPR